MDGAEDKADVARVLAGHVTAFESIVRRWQGPLVNLAYRFCRDRGRAEELAQEAFLRAYRGLAQWRSEGLFSTWLFALATNLYCSELRRVPARTVPIEAIAEPRDSRAEFDAAYEQADRDSLIRRAVLALPGKYREVLVLFYFHDRDVAAAAQSLKLPEGTVKARLSRGRELLRRKLTRQLTAQLLRKEA